MNEIRVKGFKHTSFWREDSIGLVVLRTDSHGFLSPDALNELMIPLTTALTDPEVKTVAITGQNNYFCTGLRIQDVNDKVKQILESAAALSSLIFSMEKPIVSILNGHAKDFGYELALISDYIISTDENKAGFHNDYLPILGSSCTGKRFVNLCIERVKENSNVDRIFPRANLLGDAQDFIMKRSFMHLSYRRNLILPELGNALNFEHVRFLKSFAIGNCINHNIESEGIAEGE